MPMVGLISEIEEKDSARFNGYPWPQWKELTYDERVDGVAYFRLTRLIDMCKEDAVSREVARRSRSPTKRKKN